MLIMGIPIFALLVFSAILDQQGDELSRKATESAQQKIADLKKYVAEHEPVETRYIFDDVLHTQTINANPIEAAPAFDLVAEGVTWGDQNAADDYKSVKRVISVASGQEVSFYEEIDSIDTISDDRFSLIAFTNTTGEENIGWIASKYLFTKADYTTASNKYYSSPEGKICKKHPDWSYTDCTKVAAEMVWIGMSLDMLKEERGIPNSANPSNYGSGTQWQWCWTYRTPSCFYDNDNDGLIDSYN